MMSAGAISLTGDPRRWANEPGIPGVVRFFDPYKYRSHLHRDGDSDATFTQRCLDEVEETIMYEGGHTIAAMFVETVTGTNGLIVPPDGFIEGLRTLCDRYGIVLILDEVMTGFGRTGKWFAAEHAKVAPDIMTFAKGVNCGYVPLGGAMVDEPNGVALVAKMELQPEDVVKAGHVQLEIEIVGAGPLPARPGGQPVDQ